MSIPGELKSLAELKHAAVLLGVRVSNLRTLLLLVLSTQVLFVSIDIQAAHAGCDTYQDCLNRTSCRMTCVPAPGCDSYQDCLIQTMCHIGVCEETNPIRGFSFPKGASVVVFPFRDNRSEDPNDSRYTGAAAQAALVTALRRHTDLEVRAIKPTLDRVRHGWTREEALVKAGQMGVAYLIYGECADFYRVTPVKGSVNRAAVWLEIVHGFGEVVFRDTVGGFAAKEPEAILERLASDLVTDWVQRNGKSAAVSEESVRVMESWQLQERDGLHYAPYETEPFSGRISDGGELSGAYGTVPISGRIEGSFRNGKKHGKWMDSVGHGFESEWKDGKKHGKWSWFGGSDGSLSKQEEWKDGKKHGKWTDFEFAGFESEWKDGKKHGKWSWWNSDGSLEKQEEWKDGKRHGKWLWIPYAGRWSKKIEYKDGKRHGKWVSRTHNWGDLIFRGTYEDGKKHGRWTHMHDQRFGIKEGVIEWRHGEVVRSICWNRDEEVTTCESKFFDMDYLQ